MNNVFVFLAFLLFPFFGQSQNADWCPYENKYAIVVMGGSQAPETNLYGWYWGDTYGMYNRLINNFDFEPDNIRFLSYGDSLEAHPDEVYGISTIANVTSAYNWLIETSTEEDLCFVYWVDHGGTTSFLLNNGTMSHYNIGLLTKAISARCFCGAYNPCNSGAIIDNVSQERVISIASVLPTQLNSFGWAGNFNVGVTGGSTSNPSDLDGNGVVSFSEVFEWISPIALQYGENCTYDDNGDELYSVHNTASYDPSTVGQDGFFGKNHSLSGWNCSNTATQQEACIEPFIYPNPTNGNLYIHASMSENLECEIYNLSGQRLMATSEHGTYASMNLSELQKGVYILRVNGQIHKIVKE